MRTIALVSFAMVLLGCKPQRECSGAPTKTELSSPSYSKFVSEVEASPAFDLLRARATSSPTCVFSHGAEERGIPPAKVEFDRLEYTWGKTKVVVERAGKDGRRRFFQMDLPSTDEATAIALLKRQVHYDVPSLDTLFDLEAPHAQQETEKLTVITFGGTGEFSPALVSVVAGRANMVTYTFDLDEPTVR